MVLKYLRLHNKSNLEAVVCEHEIIDDQVVGFIDVVFKEKDSDKWWICDLKTSSRLSSTLISRLPQDRQLNLYAYFADQIADTYGLKLDQYQGCRYPLLWLIDCGAVLGNPASQYTVQTESGQ